MTTSVLSACKLFGKCADDPSVLELLQKMFCKNKTGKQITVISHENRAKTEKNSNNYQEKKNLLGVEFVCLRHEIFTKSNVDKKSLTLCLRQLSLTVQRLSNKGNHLCRLGN